MEKLQLLIEDTHDSQDNVMTSYKKFQNEIVEKDSEKDDKIQYLYQDD